MSVAVAGIFLAGCSGGSSNNLAKATASSTPTPAPSSSTPVQQATASSTPTPAASSPTPGPKTRLVKEHLCDSYDYRPSEIIVACGDGNARVVRLRWSQWTSARALGVGTWQQNDCKPYCAAGTFHDYPVRLALDQPIGEGATRFFGHVVADFPSARPPYPAYRSGHTVLMVDGRIQ